MKNKQVTGVGLLKWEIVSLSGFDDYDFDDGVLARVIAESQHEYLASLKKNATSSSDESAAGSPSESMSEIGIVAAPDSGKGKSIMPRDGRH